MSSVPTSWEPGVAEHGWSGSCTLQAMSSCAERGHLSAAALAALWVAQQRPRCGRAEPLPVLLLHLVFGMAAAGFLLHLTHRNAHRVDARELSVGIFQGTLAHWFLELARMVRLLRTSAPQGAHAELSRIVSEAGGLHRGHRNFAARRKAQI